MVQMRYEFHKFLAGDISLRSPGPNLMRNTMLEMISQQLPCDTRKRLLRGGNLNKNIRAVPVLLHHLMHTANLAFNSFEAMEVGPLLIRIHRESIPSGAKPPQFR
jgi:hypothetical protein